MKRDPLPAHVLATRIIPNVAPNMAKELGLTPALCHPDHTMLFPAEKMPERKKPPESLWAALRGQVLCTGILHRYITVIQFRSGSGSQAEPSAAEVRAA